MFRRAWWTRRRIVVSLILAVVLVVIWCASRTGYVFEGQSFEEAEAALRRGGAVEQQDSFGFFFGVPRREMIYSPPDRVASHWEFPDGRTLVLIGFRKSPDQPYHVESFGTWQGWPIHGNSESNRLPETKSLLLFHWLW